MVLDINWIMAIYLAGFLIQTFFSFQCYSNFKKVKQKTGVDLLNTIQNMKSYLFFKPIFWPFYFITEKSPLSRLSELFFSHYGDEGHTYFNNEGIKNFCNDVFKGKNRYKDYIVNSMIWPLAKDGKAYQEHKHFSDNETIPYANIIYAQYNETLLFGITYGDLDCLKSNSKLISRFNLDQCEKITLSTFHQKLSDINPEHAKIFFNSNKNN